MKPFRGLKKSRILKDQDPEKSAQEKLALFSEEPFNQQNLHSQRWAFLQMKSQNLKQQPEQIKKQKIRKKSCQNPKINLRKNFFLLKNTQNQTSDLKKYCQIYCNQNNINSYNIFPQKKSLSLTNYMLFDKRKSVISEEKNISTKNEEKKVKSLRLKKLFLPKQQKKKNNSESKMNQKSQSCDSYRLRTNTRHNLTSLDRNKIFEQGQKKVSPRPQNRSYLQVTRVLSALVKRKQVPNINLEGYHKSYFAAKKKLEQSKYIESSISSSKIKLLDNIQKYIN